MLLSASEPRDDLKALVESTAYSASTVCLKGSPLVDRDLARACAHRAAAVFVLIDHRHFSARPGRPAAAALLPGILSGDEANLLRALSVRAFAAGVPVITQVLLRDDGDDAAVPATLAGELALAGRRLRPGLPSLALRMYRTASIRFLVFQRSFLFQGSLLRLVSLGSFFFCSCEVVGRVRSVNCIVEGLD